jgi:hypothetical protein
MDEDHKQTDPSVPTGPPTYTFEDPSVPSIHMPKQFLEEACPIDLQPSTHDPETLASNLGNLHRLPHELIYDILETLLPLASLMAFRNTNRYARYYVEQMAMFRRIIEYAPHVLRGCLLIESSDNTNLRGLYRGLEQRHCVECGDLAQHFWLPTASRKCYTCLTREPHLWNLDTLLWMDSKWGLPPGTQFRSIRGTFACPGRRVRLSRRDRMYSLESGLPSACYWPPWPVSIRPSGEPHAGSYGLRRIMATVLAPWISPHGEEYGLLCAACGNTMEADHVPHTRASFLKHLVTCRIRPFDKVALSEKAAIASWYRPAS